MCGGDVSVAHVEASVLVQVVLPVLKDLEAKHSKAALGEVSSAITSTTLEYVAALCSTLIWVKNFEPEDWEKVGSAHTLSLNLLIYSLLPYLIAM